MGIVEEIIDACKTLLDGYLTGFSRIDYEYEISQNSERSLEKRYGFISGPADFAEGRAIGFTTMDHIFTLILSDDYQAQDDDSALRTTLFNMYQLAQNTIKELQKSKLTLPTPDHRIKLISGQSFEPPEIFAENGTVVLRVNFNIQYQYRNN